MKFKISEGQNYIHQDGEEYEVLETSKLGVMFSTSDDELVYMELPDLIESLEKGVLTLSDEEGEEDDDEGEAEEDEAAENT